MKFLNVNWKYSLLILLLSIAVFSVAEASSLPQEMERIDVQFDEGHTIVYMDVKPEYAKEITEVFVNGVKASQRFDQLQWKGFLEGEYHEEELEIAVKRTQEEHPQSSEGSAIQIPDINTPEVPVGDINTNVGGGGGAGPVAVQGWDPQYGISTNKEWTIQFNVPVDKNTVNSQNIFVKDVHGQKMDGIGFMVINDGKSVVVKPPVFGYQPGREYYLYISKYVKSLNGKPLKKDIEMKFVTRSE